MRAKKVIIDFVHEVFRAKTEQDYSACPKHPMEIGRKGCVLLARDVDDGVV
ncbi:MAG: hypothetical protein M0C28_28605 [Candidatus Moduliflexus flocculans]|nr:hypothetical protein [Candidatus Moduliflexus flocculans]